MPDLIVVVPGIMGSVLSVGGRDLWNTSVTTAARALPDVAGRLAGLALPDGIGDEAPDAPVRVTPTDLVRGWHLWPGFWAGAGYGSMIADFLRRSRDSGHVRLFPYDWRLSNRLNARRLDAFVGKQLPEWRLTSNNAGAKVVLIAHSMGGLISRYYLEVLGGRESVRRLVTLGTPYSGSIKAIQQLTGHLLWPLGRWQEPLRRAARSMPSLWQLLPTYHCVATDSGPIRIDQIGIPGLDDADARTKIADALRFHHEIAMALKANGEPNYTHEVVIGNAQRTPQSISLSGTTIRYHDDQRGQDHLGDGTVPRFSAAPPEWADDARARAVVCRHGSLPDHRQIRDQLWNIAHAVDLGAVLAPPIELALDVPDVIPMGEPLPVRVRANRDNARIVARIKDLATGAVVTERRLRSGGEGTYAGELAATPGIWEIEAVAVAELPKAAVRDLVVVVDQE